MGVAGGPCGRIFFRGGAREMYAIGISDDCIVGGNRVGASPTAWITILAGPPCLGARAIALEAQ